RRFKEYMGSDFMTREELLVKASAEAHNATFLKDSTLIFDSFTGFTPVQYTFIEALLTQCGDIYICLTRTKEGRGSLFSLGDKTYEHLEAIAEHHGGLDVIESGDDIAHLITSDIAKLGRNIFESKPAKDVKQDGTVSFFKTEDAYGEIHEILVRIARLVRERDYHYRECGILMGDTALYADIVRSEARNLGIPVYVDQTRHISLNPFTELIRAVLLVLKENYSYNAVFHLLRSGLTDIKTDDIDIAENYILATGIRGKSAYQSEFKKVFKGASEEARQTAERVRAGLNEMLVPICDVLGDKKTARTGDLIAAVRLICDRLKAKEKLEEYSEKFEAEGDPERAIEYSQIYDILNSQFDNMDSLIGDQEVTIREFSELYEDALSEIRVGVIPPKSDVVMAGDLTRSRFNHIRALFFVGMTEGAIPAAGNKGGLISDGDRQILKAIGIEVAPTAAENAEKEKFYFYMNLMKPKDEVCFSYPSGTLDGSVNRESYFLKEARRCLGAGDAKIPERQDAVLSVNDLLSVFSKAIEEDEAKAAVLLRSVRETGQETVVIDRLTESLIRKDETEQRLDDDAGKLLFGKTFIESPTELERFAACPYEHFLGYGLRLGERRGFEFEMRDIGTLLHKVLELFSRRLAENRLTFRNVTDDIASKILENSINDAATETTSGRIASLVMSNARYRYAYERLKKYAARSIDTLRFQAGQGTFDNIYFEKRFRSEGLTGTIDRSDEAVTGSGIFIDIIDYKTGNKSFDPDRIYHGLDIQLPIYMNAALEMRRETASGTVRPAGLFYYHVDDPVVEGSRETSEAEVDNAVRKELRLRGVVNADMDAVRAFDRDIVESGKSVVIPAGFRKDGTPEASAKLYPEEALNGLINHTVELSKRLRQDITGGDVSRRPFSLGGRTGCDHCAYKEICDGGRKRVLTKQSFPEAWIGSIV
ncbi:MAG: PD-(D/E)XK nuclease family protein, partial [Lachnospiraceae bacterium]|nr:PD-(D/E)XK nuclease family protein [Lachnospiraceae bacterium]